MEKKVITLQSQINGTGNKKKTFGKEKENRCAICNKVNGCQTVSEASRCNNNPGKKKKT